MRLSLLYRGPLSSCNYECAYCPFAKHQESAAELHQDRVALERFVDWVAARPAEDRLGILFTPWGEALTRSWYREALIRLGGLPQVLKTAVQTNLACSLSWVERCDKAKLALWATYHPSQVTHEKFLGRCCELLARGTRFSVGIVGLREHFPQIERSALTIAPIDLSVDQCVQRQARVLSTGRGRMVDRHRSAFSLQQPAPPQLG